MVITNIERETREHMSVQLASSNRARKAVLYAQVFLAKDGNDKPNSGNTKDGLRDYVLVVRLGNDLQEINVQSSYDREAMKPLIAETVTGGGSLA